ADHDSKGAERNREALPAELLAAVHPARAALRHDSARLELDDELGRRLVLSDGGRAIHAGSEGLSATRPWLVPSRRRRLGRLWRLATRDDNAGPRRRAARRDPVAAAGCLVQSIQGGAGRGSGRPDVASPDRFEAVSDAPRAGNPRSGAGRPPDRS